MIDLLEFIINTFKEVIGLSFFQYAAGFIFVIALFEMMKKMM